MNVNHNYGLFLCKHWNLQELKIISMHCWLVGFRDWWVNMRNEEWPVRLSKNFHGEAWWYANNMRTGNLETSSDLDRIVCCDSILLSSSSSKELPRITSLISIHSTG